MEDKDNASDEPKCVISFKPSKPIESNLPNTIMLNIGSNLNPSLNSYILDFFANKLHPISMLNDSLFKYLLQPFLRSVNMELSEQRVLHQILMTSIHIKDAIRLRIRQTIFALKIDLIIGPKLIIMGIHVQHIFDKAIHLYTLSLQQIRNETTDAQIRIMILEVLYSYNIEINQILITTTDLNILDNLENQFEIGRIVYHFKLACSDFLHFVGCTRTIPAIRLIEKCIKRFLHRAEVQTHLNLCHDLILIYHTADVKSNSGCKVYCSLKPPFACWKLTIEMVNHFLELRTSKFHLLGNPQLTSEQVKFLEEFVKIGNSIQKLTVKLEDYSNFDNKTFSNLYIMLMELKLIVKKTTKTRIGTIFIEELEKSFSLIMNDHIFLSSIYLDPRIRICLNTTQMNEVKILLINLNKKIFLLKNKSSRRSHHVYVTTPANSSSSVKNHSPFQEYLESLGSSRSQETQQSRLNLDFSCYELECNNRLPMDTDILEFWFTKQNHLTELANAIQAIPITQATMERNLVAYNYVHNNSLVLSEVENILLIKFNCHFQCN